MEVSAKDQQSTAEVSAKGPTSKLKNSLRSSTSKLKADKSPPMANLPSSASKRARAVSSVSKSVNVLDLSGKWKSPKPPRRLSTPSKSATKTNQKPASNITPISEARVRNSVTTPLSEVSRSSNRRKFNVLLSASYWLSQIKVSEAVCNHSISLGFFRLALEAGCEPFQRLRDELKAYATKHNLTKLDETIKPLFESYGITETLEQLQASETRSQETVDGTQSSSSNEPVNISRSLMDRKQSVTEAIMNVPVKSVSNNTSASKVRASITRKSITLKPAAERESTQSSKKRSENPKKLKPEVVIKKQEKKTADEASVKQLTEAEEIVEENKENMDGPPVEEISVTEGK